MNLCSSLRTALAASSALALFVAQPASAQVIGEQIKVDVSGYIPISSSTFNPGMISVDNVRFASDNSPYYYSSADLLCINPGLSSRGPGSTNVVYNVLDPAIAFYDQTLTSPELTQGTAYVNWLVDNYYDSYVVNPVYSTDSQRLDLAQAFDNVLKELIVDWTGVVSSLNGSSGGYVFTMAPMTDYTIAYDLLSAVMSSGVDPSYQSSLYSISYLQDAQYPANATSGPRAQNMLSIATLTPVPEPSSGLFAVLGAMLLLRRKRSA